MDLDASLNAATRAIFELMVEVLGSTQDDYVLTD